MKQTRNLADDNFLSGLMVKSLKIHGETAIKSESGNAAFEQSTIVSFIFKLFTILIAKYMNGIHVYEHISSEIHSG